MNPELRRACARAVHVLTPEGRLLRAGRATLYILGRIGWPRTAAILRRAPWIWLVELGYFLVARTRGWISRFV